MKAPHTRLPLYRLIRSQEMVQFMWKYTLHKQATQIPTSVAFDEALDFSLLARAVDLEIERNDCLRLRFLRRRGKVLQYFLPQCRPKKIPLKEFAHAAAQTAFFNADAQKALDVFGGETFRIFFFKTGGKSGIYLNVSHIVMDAAAVFTFFADLMAVYDCLKAGAPLPRALGRYEDVVKNEQDNPALGEKIARQRQMLYDWIGMDRAPAGCMLNGTALLEKQRKLLRKPELRIPLFTYLPWLDKTHFVKLRLSEAQSAAIFDFLQQRHLSPEWLLQLGFRLCFSKLNARCSDTLFWVLCPRRKTVQEKRCGGTLASPLPWREILPENLTFAEALKQIAETQAFLFRCADVPFTEVRSIEQQRFGLSLTQSCNSMMFSYLPMKANSFGERSYVYTCYDFGHYVMPLYTMVTQDFANNCLAFCYIHRTHFTTDAQVKRFHDGTVRALLAGIAAPEKTLAQIMEEV